MLARAISFFSTPCAILVSVGFFLALGKNTVTSLPLTSVTSKIAYVCPVDHNGATVYVRLWSYFNGTGWQFNDYAYTSGP